MTTIDWDGEVDGMNHFFVQPSTSLEILKNNNETKMSVTT